MLLVPTHDSPGVNREHLAESQAFRAGSFRDVPVAADWIKVSKKTAMSARRAIAERGQLDAHALGAVGSMRYSASKIARAQLGQGLHKAWMTDLIKHCGTKAFLFVILHMAQGRFEGRHHLQSQ